MSLIEAVIRALIYLCCLALAYFLTLWVLTAIGIVIPAKVATIMGVIFVLVAILVLIRLLWPTFASYSWFPPKRP